MKKINKMIIASGLALSIVGCSEPQSVDEKFISSLEKGLMDRWDIVDSSSADTSTTEGWNNLLDAELNNVAQYKNQDFENEDLEKCAKEYIEALEGTKEITDMVESSYSNFQSEFQPYYQERLLALQDINEIQELTFDQDSDKKSFKDLMNEAKTLSQINQIMDNTKFEVVEDEYGWKTLQANVENITDNNFQYFTYDINLLDSNGTVIETTTAWTDNWDKGTTHVFEFTTDKEYATIEIHNVEWS